MACSECAKKAAARRAAALRKLGQKKTSPEPNTPRQDYMVEAAKKIAGK